MEVIKGYQASASRAQSRGLWGPEKVLSLCQGRGGWSRTYRQEHAILENARGPGVHIYLCIKAGKEAGEGWEALFCKYRLATVKQSDWCSGKLTAAEAQKRDRAMGERDDFG